MSERVGSQIVRTKLLAARQTASGVAEAELPECFGHRLVLPAKL
jgi:hypothetical protein